MRSIKTVIKSIKFLQNFTGISLRDTIIDNETANNLFFQRSASLSCKNTWSSFSPCSAHLILDLTIRPAVSWLMIVVQLTFKTLKLINQVFKVKARITVFIKISNAFPHIIKLSLKVRLDSIPFRHRLYIRV